MFEWNRERGGEALHHMLFPVSEMSFIPLLLGKLLLPLKTNSSLSSMMHLRWFSPGWANYHLIFFFTIPVYSSILAPITYYQTVLTMCIPAPLPGYGPSRLITMVTNSDLTHARPWENECNWVVLPRTSLKSEKPKWFHQLQLHLTKGLYILPNTSLS